MENPIPILFAPLQGYTDSLYRQLHHELVGGVQAYFTPFLRWEKGGLRAKDRKELEPQGEVPTVVQVIACDREEMARLCDVVQQAGHSRIDLNLGCPFPLQTRAGRGSALLPHPEKVAPLLREMEARPEVQFSVKMRLGMEQPDEWCALLPMLQETPLRLLTVHARIARQQYAGEPQMEQFERLYESCTLPLAYNGDLTTPAQIAALQHRFPRLRAVMIGRGLLARPTLAQEYRSQEAYSLPRRLAIAKAMHQRILASPLDPSQRLTHIRALWEYQEALLDKRSYKNLMKTGRM